MPRNNNNHRCPEERRRRELACCLAVALQMLPLTRASADENNGGYRHEFYHEDKNRIEVNTDTAHFDAELTSKVRVTADLVLDAISGATPTGAPPQTKWPFPTFNNLYQSAYGQAYTSQFNQYTSANQIYVDAGYETYQQMTNLAAQFASTTAPGIATNSAGSAYHALTNNVNFKKSTVPLTEMRDHRLAFSMGVPVTITRHQITPSIALSEESDYISRGGALNDAISFNNKNTTLNLGWSYRSDRVRDDQFVWQNKISDDFLLGVTQLLSPKSYVTMNVSFGNESGYLSDPYRGIMAATNFFQTNPDDAALTPEKRPRHRDKEIVYLSYLKFFDRADGSLEVAYRYFHDSYGINAHTADLQWHQKLGKSIVISPVFRYYYQSAADFYYELVPDFNHLPTFYSADYRLSNLQTFTLGLQLTYRIRENISLDASYSRYVMEGLDTLTSSSAYPSANIVSLGLRVWF